MIKLTPETQREGGIVLIMVKSLLKRRIKLIIILAAIVLILLFIMHLYMSFVLPLMQPYFFRIRNIERLSGLRLPRDYSWIVEYRIEAEPTARLGRIRGMKGIQAKVAIDEYTFEKWRDIFNDDGRVLEGLIAHSRLRYGNILNVDNIEEIHFRVFHVSKSRVEHLHLFNHQVFSTVSRSRIVTVITMERGLHYLYVFYSE